MIHLNFYPGKKERTMLLCCRREYSKLWENIRGGYTLFTKGNMLHREQNEWNSRKKYSVVHPLIRMSIAGFFSLLSLGLVFHTLDRAQAHQGYNPVVRTIKQVFGPHAQAALRVARWESGLNAGAYNSIGIRGSHSIGVFQILYPGTWRGTSQGGRSPYNLVANVVAAHDIFVRDGYSWHEWVCQP